MTRAHCSVSVVDSHTGGEPTRVALEGVPDLGSGSVADKARRFREQHDCWRSALVMEPRGSDVLVGALLVEPEDAASAAGVIFFNNVGLLGMCGHGMIGLIATLAHLGKIGPGRHRVETPVGAVTATLHPDGSVSVQNVPSFRTAERVSIPVEGIGPVTGDVAWGGNWFFLVREHDEEIALPRVERLTQTASRIRQAVNAHGYPEVDHVELFGPPSHAAAQAKNFVLCPGGAFDRSPCGTGTSAKAACLAADGRLAEGEEWVQESIVGSLFRAAYEWSDRSRGVITPTITGSAFITGEATLRFDIRDPFRWGIRARS